MRKTDDEKSWKTGTKRKRRGVKLSIYFMSLAAVAVLFFMAGQRVSSTSFSSSLGGENGVGKASETAAPLEEIGGQRLTAVYETILQNYIGDVDENALVEGALSGMVEAIDDPYSQYLTTEEAANLDESIDASFEGIGAEIMNVNDQIIVVSPMKGSPAEAAGLLPNDVILSADGQSLKGMTAQEAVTLIRGEKGTEVELEIQRGDQTLTVPITRDTIPIETVTYQMAEEAAGIGVVQVSSFSKPTYDEVVQAVTSLREQGAKKFIFDFRGNPGGLLDQALRIGNMFVDDGEVLVQTQEKGTEPQPIFSSDSELGDFQIHEPTVMLVDEGSASASEIVAGTLQEAAGIPLVGSTTFGKGTVQTIYPLTPNSELKLTVAKWLTPHGNWIHDEGITPDYEVALPEYASLTIIDASADYTEGAVSEAVKNVELMLEAVGYEVTADGFYDANTVTQVAAFQTEHGLAPSGEVEGETAVALVETLREVLRENDPQYAKAVEVLQGQ